MIDNASFIEHLILNELCQWLARLKIKARSIPRVHRDLWTLNVNIFTMLLFTQTLRTSNIYIYIYIYMCVCVCVCGCVYLWMYMCMYTFTYVSVYIYLYVCMYTSVSIYIYVCLYIYICSCVCVYIYVYAYIYYLPTPSARAGYDTSLTEFNRFEFRVFLLLDWRT